MTRTPDPRPTCHDVKREMLGALPAALCLSAQELALDLQMRSFVARLLAIHLRSPRQAITAAFERWRDASLHLVHERDEPDDPRALQADWSEFVRAERNHPLIGAQLRLLEVMLASLPDILCGKRQALEVMFPGGSAHLVENLYVDSRIYDYVHKVTAAVVAGIAVARHASPGAASLRILEVGAGTGSTARQVLRELTQRDVRIEEYCFTDISRYFIRKARAGPHWRAVNMTFRLLDIAEDPSAHVREHGTYDVLIAANVLHATPDITATLRNARALLRPGGFLVMNETLGVDLLAHVTFGLLDGWWQHRDAQLREPGTTALATSTWLRLLAEVDFDEALDLVPERTHELGQQVIVARRSRDCASRRDEIKSREQADLPIGQVKEHR